VDKSYSHLTLLGDAIRKFDFVAQTFSVVSVETDHVVLGPAFGEPVLVRLSHLTYDELSRNLSVWEHGDTGYHVIQEMPLWLQVFPTVFIFWSSGIYWPMGMYCGCSICRPDPIIKID
jgi:hypothetical protein